MFTIAEVDGALILVLVLLCLWGLCIVASDADDLWDDENFWDEDEGED